MAVVILQEPFMHTLFLSRMLAIRWVSMMKQAFFPTRLLQWSPFMAVCNSLLYSIMCLTGVHVPRYTLIMLCLGNHTCMSIPS